MSESAGVAKKVINVMIKSIFSFGPSHLDCRHENIALEELLMADPDHACVYVTRIKPYAGIEPNLSQKERVWHP